MTNALLLRRRGMMVAQGGGVVPVEPVDDILTFVANTGGSSVKLSAVGAPPSVTLSYMTDGLTWNSYTIGDEIQLPYVGSWVKFKGTNAKFGSSTSAYHHFVMVGSIASHGDCTSLLNASGGSMTIPNTSTYAFCSLFYGCSQMTTAPNIPVSSTGASSVFRQMFRGCSRITTAPEIFLPTIPNSGCREMFRGCSLLNYVKMHTTSIGSSGTASWLSSVSASGTIVCPSSLTLSNDVNGLPSGWARVDL